MSKKRSFIFLLFLLVVISPLSEAQEAGSHDKTRIEIDSEVDEIRFFVGDQIVAILDGDGFRVRGEISYAGALTNLIDPDNVIPATGKKQEASDDSE